jgi:hypothetical protein
VRSNANAAAAIDHPQENTVMQILSPRHRLACLLALSLVASGCAGSEPRAGDAKTGSIEGAIQHPAHVIPSMRICAIGSGQPAARVCVTTRNHQASYRIDGLAPDDYIVIATAQGSLYAVGGHVQPVQCIRAPCPEMPAAVTVAAGANVADVDINGFYEKRDDFPVLPPK